MLTRWPASARATAAAARPNDEESAAGSISSSSPLSTSRARTSRRPSRRAAINCSKIARRMSGNRLDQDFDLPAAEQADLEHPAVTDTERQAAMFAVGQRAVRSFDHGALDTTGGDRTGEGAVSAHHDMAAVLARRRARGAHNRGQSHTMALLKPLRSNGQHIGFG